MKTMFSHFKPSNLSFKIPVSIVIFALILMSCSNEDAPSNEYELQEPNIIELIESFNSTSNSAKASDDKDYDDGPTFEVLSKALAQTKLASTVSRNRLTVFAPTDAAFAELGLTTKNIKEVENLASILLYHVIGMPVYSGDLVDGPVETANGNVVNINLQNGVMVNDAAVTMADLKARNGVVHVIDKVLFPPTKSIAGIANSMDNFSILFDAVVKAELGGVLTNDGPFTVFAPTNQAFIDLLAATPFDSLDDIPKDLLTQILLYHVVDGYAFSNQLSNGFVPTLNGAAVNVDLSSGVMINDAEVIAANVQATNGVVHGINKVLMPPTMNLVDTASSFAPEFSILLAAATKAELAGALMGDVQYTVFAPTNQAFIDFLKVADVDAALAAIEGLSAEALAPIILYHVVPGRVYSSDLSSGEVDTLNGSFMLDLGTLKIDDEAMLIPELLNVQATNGVIHVIDAVLTP